MALAPTGGLVVLKGNLARGRVAQSRRAQTLASQAQARFSKTKNPALAPSDWRGKGRDVVSFAMKDRVADPGMREMLV